MTLPAQVRALLDEAVKTYRGTPQEEQLQRVAERLDEPLRVAIAGRVKAGKSTLLNALVGERVAATDAGECTKVVTWYSDGVAYRAWAYPRSGKTRQVRFVRDGGATTIDLEDLRAEELKRLRVEFPSDRLRRLTLIDTPGIASLSTDLSRRTHEFLTGTSEDEEPADAVLYVMRHLHTSDVNFLEAFHDREFGGSLPVNAIGVLSRADEIGSGRTDAIDLAQRVAQDYRRDPVVRGLVQTVIPVAGLLAQAGTTLTEREFAALHQIATAPMSATALLLLSVDRFAAEDADTEVPAGQRRELLARLGMFGVRLSVGLIQHRFVVDATELSAELLERSGLRELQAVLLSQFSARRDILKAERALRAIDDALAARPVAHADRLRARQDQILASAHDFAELRLLGDLRTGVLDLPEQQRESMERLLGADGGSIHARLGLPADAPADEVQATLHHQLATWQRLSESPLADQRSKRAAAVLRRTCEGMYAEGQFEAGQGTSSGPTM